MFREEHMPGRAAKEAEKEKRAPPSGRSTSSSLWRIPAAIRDTQVSAEPGPATKKALRMFCFHMGGGVNSSLVP